VKSLELHLRAVRDAGAKSLVPYLMAGATPNWTEHVEAAIHAGANAVEIGLPFSDPMMDGVVIQEAGLRSLRAGTTLESVCAQLERLDHHVPLIAMTYYNIFLHYGLERAAGRLHGSGVSGAIVPDLPLEESEEWVEACDARDVATILLVAPSTPPARVAAIAAHTQGFAYASARMAVTGVASDEGEGPRVVRAIRETSDVPTFIGIGVTTPDQARAATEAADGVIVGSALVRHILDGATANDVERFITQFRRAIDQ